MPRQRIGGFAGPWSMASGGSEHFHDQQGTQLPEALFLGVEPFGRELEGGETRDCGDVERAGANVSFLAAVRDRGEGDIAAGQEDTDAVSPPSLWALNESRSKPLCREIHWHMPDRLDRVTVRHRAVLIRDLDRLGDWLQVPTSLLPHMIDTTAVESETASASAPMSIRP